MLRHFQPDPLLMRLAILRLVVAALSCGLAGVAAAQTGPLPEHVADLRLIEGWRRDDGAQVAAVVIRLDPGWHTYWRAPGGIGFPPDFDWSASDNLAAVAYEWPRPEILESFGERTFGFKPTLVLPIVLTPRDPAAAIDAVVDLAFGVCKDICIRAEAQLYARFDPAAPRPEDAALIRRALEARPTDARAAGVTETRCSLGADEVGPTVTAEVIFDKPPGPGFSSVIEDPSRPDLWFGATRTETNGRRVSATARLEPAVTGASMMVDRRGLRVTLVDVDRAIDIRGCAGPG